MTTATQSLTAFLLDQIAADEAVARAAPGGEGWYVDAGQVWVLHDEDGNSASGLTEGEPVWAGGAWQHIAHHDPAHVLAVCAAHRSIVEEIASWRATGNDTLTLCAERAEKILASAYADRPGWQEAWRRATVGASPMRGPL